MLRSILAQLRTEAKDHPGKPMNRKLQKGLHISITFVNDSFRLILSRENVEPSYAEWHAVIHHWPDLIDGGVEFEHLRAGSRASLRGFIPIVHATQMRFDDLTENTTDRQ